MKYHSSTLTQSYRSHGRRMLLSGALAALAAFHISNGAVLSSHVPLAASQGQPVGRLPASDRLNLAIGLPLRNPEALTALLARLYNPSDPQFHHYLTPAQFTDAFGPSEQDYLAIISFAQAHGLTVTATHPNRMLLDVNGSVGEIERAFHLNLRLYPHPREARAFYAPDAEPQMDAPIRVLHITGLDNLMLPHPNLRVEPAVRPNSPRPQTGSGPSGTYWGNDFRGAYARGVTLTGSGQMLGLLEFDGYYTNDIRNYLISTAVPAVPLINVLLDDYKGTPGSGNIEVALDIEVANAMAPGLAAIIVYEAGPSGNGNDILNRMATDDLANQLSASWTFGIDATTSQIFQQFAAQGQSYFNASGDSGAYAGSPSTPTDNPYITSVGGTVLNTTSAGGPWSSESAWGGSSGGISTTYSIPSWQQGIDMSANLGSTSMRNIPDVAMIASQVLVRYNNGSQTSVAGTSIATPLWAAFVALCNQQAVSAGSPLVGFINPAIYALGQTAGYTTSMHDITTGNNTNSGSPTQFFAVAGYDLCTGWGSPNGSNLINALAPRPSATVISNVSASLVFEGCLPANGAVDPGETVTMSFSLKNVGAIASTNLIATLQADAGVVSPSGPQTYGALVGGGATVSRSFTFTAEGTCGSVLTATLQLQDGPTSLGSIYYNIRLGRSVTNLSQTFDGVSAPALPSGWTSARSGAASNWVTGTAQHDTGINSAFAAEPTNAGIAELTSPSIQITTSSAQLIFRNNYNMETDPTGLSKAYDGGVLEIQIGGGSYSDILTAGGSFVTGGYNGTIDPTDDNALGSRSVWSGLSGGFITTMVNLPASAAGQSIRLKWRFGTDSGNYYGGLGWYIDSVAILDGYTCCNPIADLALTMTGSRNPAGTGQPLTYTLSLANAGPEPAYSISITDSIPNNVTFSTAYPGAYFTNGAVVFPVGTLASGGTTNAFLTVTPLTAASLTNSASAAGVTTDPNLANNGATLITSVAPFIQQITPTATNVALTLNSANGLTYQLEYKNSLAASNWTPVSAPVPGNGAVITLLDTNAPPPPARFYRVRSY